MNRKWFENEVSNIKSKLTDKELFLSSIFKEKCYNIVLGVSKAYGQTLKVKLEWGSIKGPIAYATADNIVYLNLNNSMCQDCSRTTKYHRYIALLLHECGHRLFTNFRLLNETIERIQNDGILSYENCDNVNEWLCSHPKSKITIAKLFQDFWNRIEDGFIELILLSMFYGYGKHLQELRNYQLRESVGIEKMREKGLSTQKCAFNLLLNYAKYGILNADENSDDEAVKALVYCKDLVDLARHEKDSNTRMQLCCEAFSQMFKVLYQKEEKEKSSDENNEKKQDSSSSSSDDENDNENSTSISDNHEENDSKTSCANTSGTKGDEKESSSNENNSSFENSSKNSEDDTETEESLTQIADSLAEEQQGRDTTPLTYDNGQLSEDTLSPEEASVADEKVMEDLLSQVAKEKAEETMEGLLSMLLGSLNNSITYGNHHKNVKASILRQTKLAEIPYDVNDEVNSNLRRLTQSFFREIHDLQLGQNLNGLYFGNKVAQPYRQDLKRFSKDIAPEDIPDMSLVLLIDISGSTSFEEKCANGKSISRINAAKKTALLVYRFCKAVGIRISIFAHCAYMDNKVEIISLADFNSMDGKDEHRIFAIDSKNACNRDGYALRFCMEVLDKQPTTKKMLQIISDGAPNDIQYKYSFIPPESRKLNFDVLRDQGIPKIDIQNVLKECHRKGITVVTAGLGSDQNKIRDIYSDGLSPQMSAKCIDITDLNKMPVLFLNILKDALLKK